MGRAIRARHREARRFPPSQRKAAGAGASARRVFDSYDFCIAFNFFRLAAIFHGIKGRVIRGTAASAHAKARAEHFPRLARLASEAMDACA